VDQVDGVAFGSELEEDWLIIVVGVVNGREGPIRTLRRMAADLYR
jgi:hypothetical protein